MRVCGTGLGNGWFDNSVGWRVQNGKDIYIVLESSWGGKSNFSPTLGEPIQHFLQHKCVWMRVTNVVAWWAVWCAISWSIWTHRNNVLFRQGNIDMDSVIGVIKWEPFGLPTMNGYHNQLCALKLFGNYEGWCTTAGVVSYWQSSWGRLGYSLVVS